MRWAAIGSGAAVALVGFAVLVGGWWLNVAVLRQPLPSNVGMRAGTALGLFAAGVGVVSVGLRWPRAVTGICAVLTAAAGALACVTYLLGAPKALIESAIALDIDRDLAVPGRIAANTAVCLLLLGCGLILLALGRANGVRQALGVAVLSVAYVAVIGYLAVGMLPTGQYSPQATPMAPLTAGALLLSGFALLSVTLAHGWGRVFAEPLAGGQILRAVVPMALLLFAAYAAVHGALSGRSDEWEPGGLATLAIVVVIGIILLALRAQRIDAERVGLATHLEQRIAAGALDREQANTLLRAQFEGAPTGMVLVGADGRSLDVNQAFCEMLGYPRTDLVGVDLATRVVHCDDREMARAAWAGGQRDSAGAGDRSRAEVRLRHRDGHQVVARLSVGVVRDEASAPLLHICNFEDVTDEVASRHALAEAERRYRMVADSATDAVLLVDLVGVIKWASPSIKPLFGYDPESLVGRDATALIHSTDLPAVRTARARAALGESEVGFQVRFMDADGHYRWVAGKTSPARDPAGVIVGRITSFHDIQEQVDTRAALDRSEQLLRRAIDGAPQGMAIVGLDLRFIEVNDTLRHLLGREEAWFLTHTITDALHPDDVDADLAERRQLQDGELERCVRERRWLRADGTAMWVIHSKALLRDSDESALGYVSHVQDNSTAHRDRDELARRVSHDSLTGLINREELLGRLSQLLANAALTGERPGLLFCDIDFFKHVNDTLGHATGDEVLRVTANRVSSTLRGRAMVARLGGDEFVIVLNDVPDEAAAIHIAERVRSSVGEPISIRDSSRVVAVTMSVGIALAAAGLGAQGQLRNADLALYRAKRAGRDRVAIADERGESPEEVDISEAIARGQFVPWFAPVVDLADGRLAGYEALAWRVAAADGARGPTAFVQGDDISEWASEIDMVIVDQAIDVLCAMSEQRHVAVKITASTLAQGEYAQLTIGRLEGCGIDPARLHLELDEAALLGATGSARNAVFELAESGVGWYVDDFGVGYSSIPQLCELPLVGVKVDQSCTAGLGRGDAGAEQLCRVLVTLADCLGLDTVAAGIRTAEQAAILREQGWQHGQGPLFGLPMRDLK